MTSDKSDLYGVVLKCHNEIKQIDYLLELAKVINPKSVKSFGKIAGNTYGIFFNSEEDFETLLEKSEIVVKSVPIKVYEYAPAVKNIFIKGIPVIDDLTPLKNYLASYGEIKSDFARLPIKDVPAEFSHLVSHTLQIKMVLNDNIRSLPNYAKIDFGNDIITLKIEHGGKKCYKCGDRDHTIKLCQKNLHVFLNIGDKNGTHSIGGNPQPARNRVRSRDVTRKEDADSNMLVSPTNDNKSPKLANTVTEQELQASYNVWKDFKIGNGHIPNDELLSILVSGSTSLISVPSVASTFTKNSAELRRQLNALAGLISNLKVKQHIRTISEAIPIRLDT